MKTKFTKEQKKELNTILDNCVCNTMDSVYKEKKKTFQLVEVVELIQEILESFRTKLDTLGNQPAEVPGELSEKNNDQRSTKNVK